jgi:UDP-N-acetylmuramoylalanine--D-glutamate ligase
LKTMDRPTWLILGGTNKQIELDGFARKVMPLVQGVGFFGAMGQKLSTSFRQIDNAFPSYCGEMLSDAFAWCWQQSKPGDAILLSPAFPSTDQFRDFAHRGEEFERLVQTLKTH